MAACWYVESPHAEVVSPRTRVTRTNRMPTEGAYLRSGAPNPTETLRPLARSDHGLAHRAARPQDFVRQLRPAERARQPEAAVHERDETDREVAPGGAASLRRGREQRCDPPRERLDGLGQECSASQSSRADIRKASTEPKRRASPGFTAVSSRGTRALPFTKVEFLLSASAS